MPLYELEEATLDGHEGQGYAYKTDDAFGSTYHGVFFPSGDADESTFEEMKENGGVVEFTGRLYLKTTSNYDSINVEVTNTLRTGSGPRADFHSVEGIELEQEDDSERDEEE